VSHRPRGTGASVDAANHVGQQAASWGKEDAVWRRSKENAVAPTRWISIGSR